MAENKKSVLLYCDIIHTIKSLSNEEAGKLFKHYLEYINDLNPVSDRLTELLFEPIKQNLKRDLKKWEDKSLKNKEIANIRWQKKDANACERIKEDAIDADKVTVIVTDKVKDTVKDKVTDIKKEDIEDRKLKFADTLKVYIDKFGRETLLEFYAYWTEPNKSNTKFRQELEKTWDLERRILTWVKNDKNFNKKNDGTGKQNNSDRNKSDLIALVEMARRNVKEFEVPNGTGSD